MRRRDLPQNLGGKHKGGNPAPRLTYIVLLLSSLIPILERGGVFKEGSHQASPQPSSLFRIRASFRCGCRASGVSTCVCPWRSGVRSIPVSLSPRPLGARMS